jgi:hypothetical protein
MRRAGYCGVLTGGLLSPRKVGRVACAEPSAPYLDHLLTIACACAASASADWRFFQPVRRLWGGALPDLSPRTRILPSTETTSVELIEPVDAQSP